MRSLVRPIRQCASRPAHACASPSSRACVTRAPRYVLHMLPSFSRRMGSQGPVRQSASWVGRRTGDSRAPCALAGLKGRLQPRRQWRVAAPRLASSGERCADAAAVAPRSTCSMVRRSPRALHASWAAAAPARSASASSPSAEPRGALPRKRVCCTAAERPPPSTHRAAARPARAWSVGALCRRVLRVQVRGLWSGVTDDRSATHGGSFSNKSQRSTKFGRRASVGPDGSAVRPSFCRSLSGEGRWLSLESARGTGAALCLALNACCSSPRPRRSCSCISARHMLTPWTGGGAGSAGGGPGAGEGSATRRWRPPTFWPAEH